MAANLFAHNPALVGSIRRTQSEAVVEYARPLIKQFLDMVLQTNFKDLLSKERLERWLKKEKTFSQRIIHELAREYDSRVWGEDQGLQLLLFLWMDTKYNRLFREHIGAPYYDMKSLPLHFAIECNNHGFLDCFLDLCSEVGAKAREVLVLANDERMYNCLHLSISSRLPCVERMVSVCSDAALLMKTAKGDTPLHIAMAAGLGTINQGPWTQPSKFEQLNGPNMSRTRTWLHDNLDTRFRPSHVLEHMKSTRSKALMRQLLTSTNKAGKSPYQTRVETFNVKLRHPVNGQEENEAEFQAQLKELIFETLEEIPEVGKALYGTQGMEKELCLDLSDFNQSTHDFERFVERLRTSYPTKKDQKDSSGSPSETREDNLLFEDTLFFVYLPDLNNIHKPCPHKGVRSLFRWLGEKGVKKIKTLNIPDNTTSPMSDALVEEITHQFKIETFDWRKLNLNLDILTTSPYAAEFKEITLNCCGNWSVMYHWISKSGLSQLKRLKKVKINIVQLNPSDDVHDQIASRRHLELVAEYKMRLETGQKALQEEHKTLNTGLIALQQEYKRSLEAMLRTTPLEAYKRSLEAELGRLQEIEDSRAKLNVNYHLKVVGGAKWNFPAIQYQENDEPFVPRLQFLHQLLPSQNYLDDLADSRDDEDEEVSRFQEITNPPFAGAEDKRIKVAIIDNGVDRIRSNVKDMIAKGISYVTADTADGYRMLPWWMVADPHGTQMASLIRQANCHCRLYIARVGKGRKDILPENAAKAIEWALDQQVDIISISWVTKRSCPELSKAVDLAVKGKDRSRPTLVFCSTADEGAYSGEIWPAQYTDTVRIAATDKFGHLRPSSDHEEISILVPGEKILADGPMYMENYVHSTVSGSSVATALAVGIASLALVMIKTFNEHVSDEDWELFHTKKGMMSIFEKMKSDRMGVQLSALFPEAELRDRLPQAWNIEKLRPVSRADVKK